MARIPRLRPNGAEPGEPTDLPPIAGIRAEPDDLAERLERPARAKIRAVDRDEKPDRLAVKLQPDGSVDWDRVRPATREAFQRAARSLPGAGASSAPVDLPPFVGAALVGALAQIDAAIVGRLTKAPPDVLRLAAWTDAEKAMVEPAALAVANKYGGDVLSKYGEECTLALALVTITTNKIALIRRALHESAAPVPNQTSPVTPAVDGAAGS